MFWASTTSSHPSSEWFVYRQLYHTCPFEWLQCTNQQPECGVGGEVSEYIWILYITSYKTASKEIICHHISVRKKLDMLKENKIPRLSSNNFSLTKL